MKNKIIHYCWFGPKPIPKLAKKCIASWQKFLPDYEIKLWSEDNVNLNECDFIKEAYEQKKWAFVADYVRTKALYEYGGIYMDTDMELTKSVEDLLTEDFVIGVEDSGFIAAGLIIVKNKHNKYIKKMLDFYKKQKFKEIDDLFEISIPKVLTNIFKDEVDLSDTTKVIKKEKELAIYPRDYFYPLSYDRKNNVFTENTYGIHYYDASWISPTSKVALWMNRHHMGLLVKYLYSFLNLFKNKNHLIISLILSLLFTLSICNFSKYETTKVKITSLEDKNKDSNGYNVVINNIYSGDYIDNFKIKSFDFGWYNLNSRIKDKAEKEGSIELILPSAKKHTIEFLKNGESSKIKLEYNDKEEIIDLYNKNWKEDEWGEEIFEYSIKSNKLDFFSIKNISDIIFTFIIFVLINLIWLKIYHKKRIIIFIPLILIYLTLFGPLGSIKVYNYDIISHALNVILIFLTCLFLSKNNIKLDKYFKYKKLNLLLLFICTFMFVGHHIFMPLNFIKFDIVKLAQFILSMIYLAIFLITLLMIYEKYKNKVNKGNYNPKNNKIFYLIFIGFWVVTLIAFYPVNMTSDTADQWAQALGLRPISSAHPPILSLLYRLLQNIGFNAFMVGLLQVIICGLVFGYIFSYFYKKGLNFKFLLVFACLIAIIPSNYMLVTTLWKDIYFSVFLLLISVFIYQLHNDEKFYTIKKIIMFAVSLTIVYLTRHNGIGPLVFIYIYLVLFSIIKKQAKPMILIVSSLITIFAIKGLIYPIYVEDAEEKNPDSLIINLATRSSGALLSNGVEMDKNLLKIVETNISRELLIEKYHRFNIDTYGFDKDILKYQSERKDEKGISTSDVIKIYLDNLLKSPNLVIKERLDGSSIMWTVYMPEGSFNHRYADGIYFPEGLDGDIVGVKLQDNVYQNNKIFVKPFRLFKQLTESIISIDSIVWRVGFSWIVIILITYILFVEKKYKNMLYLIPMFGNTATWVILLAHQSFRYVWYVNLLTYAYILILIFNNKREKLN